MIVKLNSLKAKQFIFVVLVVLIWQFTFPQHISASEIEINQSNTNTINSSIAIDNVCHQQQGQLPELKDKEPRQVMNITITAYSSTPDQTSGDPFITASGSRVRDGVIAANFLPIGTKVKIPEKYGDKIFTVEDRMSSRYWHRADIWMPSREQAKEWGVRYIKIEII